MAAGNPSPLHCKQAEGRAGHSGWRQSNVALAWALAFDMSLRGFVQLMGRERACGTVDGHVDGQFVPPSFSAAQSSGQAEVETASRCVRQTRRDTHSIKIRLQVIRTQQG